MADKKHGGAGRGQGSKPIYGEAMRGCTIMLTSAQRATLDKIGGPQSIRDFLDSRR